MSRPGPSTTELSTLRALTFRISSTSTSQLPQLVPAIIASLANCKSLLSSAQASGSQSSSDASVAIHKFRTLLSTLLQDRTIQGRWSAIVLIKATLEVGGWETLQKCLPWVRGLLGILSKPDPPSSKRLCLITLTRVFVLTRDYPTLIREITTPSLPAYIQSCLQLALSKCPASLLEAVLESFNQLLARHPTVFRSYVKQIQQLLGQVLAPTPSSKLGREQLKGPALEITYEVSEAARRLYVQLPCCAPKGASCQEWDKTLKDVVMNTHRVSDKVFRAVMEDWQSSYAATPTINGHALDDEVQDLDKDAMNLTPWSGIFAGGERLVGLLRLIKEHLVNPTPGAVNLQVGLIMDLVTRILSLTVPTVAGSASFANNVRFNNQVSKEERENLWIVLPEVHVEATGILIALTSRLDDNASALDLVILDQLVWLFGAEKDHVQVRASCYGAIAQVLMRSGLALPKPSIDSLAPIIRKCCDDILPVDAAVALVKQVPVQNKSNGAKQQQTSANADAFLVSPLTPKDLAANYVGLRQAAVDLLPVLLSCIQPQYLSDSLRTRMDRTAILTRQKEALFASVLNPPPSKKFGKPAASILPLLTRLFADEQDVESLLRPRMPVVRTGAEDADTDDDMEEDATEELEDNEDRFVGEELDSILESATRSKLATTDDIMTDAPGGHASPEPSFEPKTPLTILPDESTPGGVHSPGQTLSTNKRVQIGESVPSPAKRVKFDLEEDMQEDSPPRRLTTSSIQTTVTSSVVTIVPDQMRPSPVSGLGPSATQKIDNSDDNDDDDFGELVLGQDTDEESDN